MAGRKVIAQHARELLPRQVAFDQHQRHLQRFELDHHRGRDLTIIRDDQPIDFAGQAGAQSVQAFGCMIEHVQQHLVAQPLRFHLEAANNIAIEDIQNNRHRVTLDQQANAQCLADFRRGHGIAELRDCFPDALARLIGYPWLAAHYQRHR